MSLLTLAKASAEEAESYLSDFSTLTLEYAHGCFTVKQFSHENGYALRTINGSRLGFSSCNSEAGFQETVDAALRSSAASPEVKYSFPHAQKCPYLRTKNWDIEKLDEKFAMQCAQQVVDAIREKAEPARVSLTLSFGKEEIENTNGLSACMDGSTCSVYAEAKKGDLFGFSYYSSRFLPRDFGALGREAAAMAEEMQDARALPTGKYTVCFSPYCLSQLVDFLLFHLSSENVRRGVSALSKKKGEQAFSEKLTITDSLSANASRAWPFDAEGVPAKPITLIEKGKVADFLYDTYTAARMGEEKAGNCVRASYSMPPAPSQSNTVIGGGDYPAHLASDCLYVESFHGMHTSNSISGDFGVQADIAFFMRAKGEKFPVTNMLLTGNIFNLFNSIVNVGDTQATWDDLIAPKMWFSGVQLVGPK
ncbi:MAG: TldD/PmbA family protein [Candidatus ainarchaeum sp.]|nr:TldD/PmbA family protein [Candidatus ainarchaeum sp.]MDD5096739.1 TldD/PmbA family protein [Candidatus ainarchaeum sp.]